MSVIHKLDPNNIFSVWGCGFGDVIVTASALIRLSEQSSQTIKFSTNCDKRLRTVLALFKNNRKVVICDSEPSLVFFSRKGIPCREKLYKEGFRSESKFNIFSMQSLFNHNLAETKCVWQANQSRTFCYCFKARSRRTQKESCINEQIRFLKFMKTQGYTPVELGKHLSDIECVKALSICEFYVGIDCGLTHLALCTRVPVCLIKNQLEESWLQIHYPNRSLNIIPTLEILIRERQYVENLKKKKKED